MTSTRTPRILLCIGDLVEDIIIWHQGDTVVGTDNPAIITRARGGSAANVAAFAAAHTRTRFVGRVGEDSIGRALADELATAGVDVRVQRHGRTGAIVVQIGENGERTMFPDRGAAAELADVDLVWAEGAAAVHISAYALARPASAAAVLAVARAARAEGAMITLDAASVDLVRSVGPDRFLALVDQLRPDFYFANADEARELPPAEVVASGAICIVKDGADPVTVRRAGRDSLTVPVPPVDSVRDTTGAGDAFAAGFLSAVLAGGTSFDRLSDADLEHAVRRGNDLAATVLSHPGASTGAPRADLATATATATATAKDAL